MQPGSISSNAKSTRCCETHCEKGEAIHSSRCAEKSLSTRIPRYGSGVSNTREQSRKVVEDYIQARRARDRAALEKLVDVEAVTFNYPSALPYPSTWVGLSGMDELIAAQAAAWSVRSAETVGLYADDDIAVLEVRMSLVPTGESTAVDVAVLEKYVIRDGRIVSMTAFYDDPTLGGHEARQVTG